MRLHPLKGLEGPNEWAVKKDQLVSTSAPQGIDNNCFPPFFLKAGSLHLGNKCRPLHKLFFNKVTHWVLLKWKSDFGNILEMPMKQPQNTPLTISYCPLSMLRYALLSIGGGDKWHRLI